MTIEKAPQYTFDFQKQYSEQRYNRLVDCLADYLADKLVDELVNDIQTATIEMEAYHLIEGNSWRQLREKLFTKEPKCNPSS